MSKKNVQCDHSDGLNMRQLETIARLVEQEIEAIQYDQDRSNYNKKDGLVELNELMTKICNIHTN